MDRRFIRGPTRALIVGGAAVAALSVGVGSASATSFSIDCNNVYVGHLTSNFATAEATVRITDVASGKSTDVGPQPAEVTVGYKLPRGYGPVVFVRVLDVPTTEHGSMTLTVPRGCTPGGDVPGGSTTTTSGATTTTRASTTTAQATTTTVEATTTIDCTCVTVTTHPRPSASTLPPTGGGPGPGVPIGIAVLGVGALAVLGTRRRLAH